MSAETLNPIQQKMAQGMSGIAAFLSEATCSAACWEAREDVCRCSCGGRNHGCMRTADGVQPVRSAKIDGVRYVLRAVGEYHMRGEAKEINRAGGPRKAEGTYTYWWDDTDRGAPARVKSATKQQLANWPELTAYREHNERIRTEQAAGIPHCFRDLQQPYLLWVREDVANAS